METMDRLLEAARLPSLEKLKSRAVATGLPLLDMLEHNWYLGMVSFGGPAVHFQFFRRIFVDKLAWLDNQTYQEQFALCQALSGPGSTKMIYAINVIHYNFWLGALAFLVWSIPGAIAAYGLSEGIANVRQQLPDPVYALLTGVNSGTVGVICLGAVQLSQKAITDKLSRILVFFGACAGLLYNALWYYPVLMIVGGLSTVVWDSKVLQRRWQKFKRRDNTDHATVEAQPEEVEMTSPENRSGNEQERQGLHRVQTSVPTEAGAASSSDNGGPAQGGDTPNSDNAADASKSSFPFSWKSGVAVWTAFFTTFVLIMVFRSIKSGENRAFDVFANLFLAGTIIFGGGPVVIPLLREYVVAEGWVSPRNFLLGLAIVQAFPGPNFNFAVYLSALAVIGSPTPRAVGALVGFLAIFMPGLILHTGAMGFWKAIRRYQFVKSVLRGINATAVGLIYTAVYRLFEIGYLDRRYTTGSPLGRDPWWIVVIATSFVGGMWFDVPAPVAILLGGIMGMIWYGVVS